MAIVDKNKSAVLFVKVLFQQIMKQLSQYYSDGKTVPDSRPEYSCMWRACLLVHKKATCNVSILSNKTNYLLGSLTVKIMHLFISYRVSPVLIQSECCLLLEDTDNKCL